MKTWRLPVQQISRTHFFLFMVAGHFAFALLDWFLFKRVNPMINAGFASKWPLQGPVWLTGLRLLYDIALLALTVVRLHDIGRSGLWLLGFAALAGLAVLLSSLWPSMALFVVAVALIVWPP